MSKNGYTLASTPAVPVATYEREAISTVRDAEGARNLILPASQGVITRGHLISQYYSVMFQLGTKILFPQPGQPPVTNYVPIYFTPSLVQRIIEIVLVFYIQVTAGSLSFVPTPFWFASIQIKQNSQASGVLTTLLPETAMLWLLTVPSEKDLPSLLPAMNFNTAPLNYFGVMPLIPSGPIIYSYKYYFSQSFINAMARLNNETMKVQTTFQLYPNSVIVAVNTGGTSTFTITDMGFLFKSMDLPSVDKLIENTISTQNSRGNYFMDTNPIIPSQLSTFASGSPLYITLTQINRIIAGIAITIYWPSVTNAFNGYQFGVVDPSGTYQILNVNDPITDKGTPISWDDVRHFMMYGCNSSNTLYSRFAAGRNIIPFSKSLHNAFKGRWDGYYQPAKDEAMRIKLFPNTAQAEVHTVTKQNGAFAYTTGTWRYRNPLNGEESDKVNWNDSVTVHANAIINMKSIQALGVWAGNSTPQVTVGSFTTTSTTVLISILCTQSDGLGAPLQIVTDEPITCNSLPEDPTVAVTTPGLRGLQVGVNYTYVIQALIACEMSTTRSGGYYVEELLGVNHAGQPLSVQLADANMSIEDGIRAA
jgi:hypothetical protein